MKTSKQKFNNSTILPLLVTVLILFILIPARNYLYQHHPLNLVFSPREWRFCKFDDRVDQLPYTCNVSDCDNTPLKFLWDEAGHLQVSVNNKGKSILKVHIGVSEYEPFVIKDTSYKGYSSYEVRSESDNIRMRVYKHKGSDCVDVSRRAKKCVTEVLTDCFDLSSSHWYGGAELEVQLWPMEKVHAPWAPYLADTCSLGGYGPVEERLFFNSKGGGVYIEEDIPLFVSINSTKLCLQAKYDNYWYVSQDNTLPELNYTMCIGSDVKTIHQVMSDRYIDRPTGIPSPDVFRRPIWTTWTQFKKHINQSIVLEYVNQILSHNFSISQVEIDDSWTPSYGDMTFDPKLFPDPKSFVESLHQKNVFITLWVHPFVNVEAKAFSLLASKGWFMKDSSNISPALTKWWHSTTAGHIDFSNPQAADWFLAELKALQKQYGIDSYKFDAGDVTNLPKVTKAHQHFMNKNYYTRLYATTAVKSDPFESRIEVRVGARTQSLPVFVRMLDRDSSWSEHNGLKSVIPTALFFGIIGYPFVLPDIIGGDRYGAGPDAELFIRWVQANALMPVMQFSIPPWSYKNNTVVEISQQMVQLHEKYSDLIIQLANQSVTTGFPIMRPLWWIAPTDEEALTVDDQFLLGDDLLVAPVLEAGQKIRKLYLPAGTWRDEVKGQEYNGGKWMDYPVTLRDLPYFSRVKKQY